jgi:2-keto-4-pentenoate hydratase/2-oxohepta-3-ene-1,7-dioic acid hydratase in catechol pathway
VRLATLSADGVPTPALAHGGEWRVIDEFADGVAGALIGLSPDRLRAYWHAARPVASADARPVLPWLLPWRPGKIVAIGLNYRDHVREAGMKLPERPLVFAKFPNALIGDGDEIRIDHRITQRVDWEVELAVVIGRRCRDASSATALAEVRVGYDDKRARVCSQSGRTPRWDVEEVIRATDVRATC